MAQSSRRKRKYDQQRRSFQNRNIFAGLLLLVATGFAIWAAVSLLPEKRPTVFLRTNFIDHSGSQKIPFAQQSCETVQQAFAEHLDLDLLNVEPVSQVDNENSFLNLPEEQISESDVLLVYLNGHLVGQEDEQVPVAYLGPEVVQAKSTEPTRDFGKFLSQIAKTKSGLKILFLDAGRYSSSPVYPSRPLNEFNSKLEKLLRQSDLGSNFWVVVSHSDHEISRASTPLESSLFAKAIAEAMKEYASRPVDQILVPDLFEKIRRRTTSWSRNFKQQSTQHPVLMLAGQGQIVGRSNPASGEASWPVKFQKTSQADSEKDKQAQPATWSPAQFAVRQQGQSLIEDLMAREFYDALPLEAIGRLESYLELGGKGNSAIVAQRYRETVENYKALFQQTKLVNQTNLRINKTRLKEKQDTVSEFRRSLLGLSLFERFRGELRLWENDQIATADGIIPALMTTGRFEVSDNVIGQSSETLVRLRRFTKDFEDYRKRFQQLNRIVDQKFTEARRAKLTPTQAEMLGRVSQRYQPLMAMFEPKQADGADRSNDQQKRSDDPENQSSGFELDMEVEKSTNRFGSLLNREIKDLYSQTAGKAGQAFAGGRQPTSDVAFRFRLAELGSEKFNSRTGVVPDIEWEVISPSIQLRFADSAGPDQWQRFRVNPFDRDPIALNVTTEIVELVKLEIALADDGVAKAISSLDFGFTSDTFEKEFIANGSQPVQLYFNFRNPRALRSLRGREIPFRIVGSGGDAPEEELEFGVVFTDDPTVELIAKRSVANPKDRKVMRGSFARWESTKLDDRWRPMMLKTLANLESTFDFSIKNNSTTAKELYFELYGIDAFSDLRADIDDEQTRQKIEGLLRKLASVSQSGGDLRKSEYPRLSLIAKTTFQTFPAGQQKSINFSVLPAGEKVAATDLAPKPVDQGLILIGRQQGRGQIEWFQWIGFQPEEAADATANSDQLLRPKQDILAEFLGAARSANNEGKMAIAVSTLNRLWPPTDFEGFPKEAPAGRLTTVPPPGSLPSTSFTANTVMLNDILDNQRFQPAKFIGDQRRLLILDLFEIPGYRLLSQSKPLGGSVDEGILESFDKSKLVGIRPVPKSLPQGWKCYPESWSLFGFDDRDLTDSRKTRTIFIGQSADADEPAENPQIALEFLLPRPNGEVLGVSSVDFSVEISGADKTWRFPVRRQHFIRCQENGLAFLTQVTAHRIERPANNFGDRTEIRVVQEGSELARWRFRGQSVGEPNLQLIPQQSRNEAILELDLKSVQPPLELSNLSISIGDKKLAGKKLVTFLGTHLSGAEKQYRFTWQELASVMELKKSPGKYRIKASWTDFFDIVHDDLFVDWEVKPPRKVKPPKKLPKKTEFVWLEIKRRGEGGPYEITDVKSFLLGNKKLVRKVDFRHDKNAEEDRIKLYGLRLGTYAVKIQMDARVTGNNPNNGRDNVTVDATIEIKKNKQVIPVVGMRK